MAWGFISELPVTQAQYDEIDAAVEDDPPGLILHIGSRSPGGMRIIDIWESEADYRRFEQEEIVPALQRMGVPPPPDAPQPVEFEVHKLRGRAS